MSVRYCLFDLDGTLLPMDQDTFVRSYFGGLAARLAPRGYDPKALVAAIWSGTKAMVKNDGSRTNEEVFWADFAGHFGEKARQDEPCFDEFYRTDFQKVRQDCGFDARSAQVVKKLKSMGFKLALATNPIFPAIATESRIAWAGLDKNDFELYTTYENSRHCKPNPDYYRDILAQLGAAPEECLMIGNDVTEDMVAETLGMKVFLLTDCLINKDGRDLSRYPQGDLDALIDYIQTL